MTAREFARDIVNGTGGFISYCYHEIPAFQDSVEVEVVLWTLNCLANPLCKGSGEAIEAIIRKRQESEASHESE